MDKIKFGTDGWRAIIAKEFTVNNVARVTIAVANWLKANYDNPNVVLGHDCRFGGELFAETATKVFCQHGIKVQLAKGFVSTPMVSYGVVQEKASLGVVLTASHNPPAYNGYKLKGDFGGPMEPKEVQEIEDQIPNEHGVDLEGLKLADFEAAGLLSYIDLETMYVDAIKANFDLEAIEKSGLRLAYDAMYGAGQNVLKRIFPNMHFLHCEHNPTFDGVAPEPIMRNLGEFSEYIKADGNIDCGLATDGDADRIGLFNSRGEFVDSHHIILLLIHYLKHYKGMTGKVATAFSTTVKVAKMCKHYGLDLDTVKIGFKYVCGIMIREDVLVGGEESGGIAIKGHIPERDGIWMGLVLWEFMAKSGKTLDQLIQEVYDIVGPFAFGRNDLHLDEALKISIIENCKAGKYTQFGDFEIQRVETIDGFKYFVGEDDWIMIRPSGTEPVLRVYAEAGTAEKAEALLTACKATLLD